MSQTSSSQRFLLIGVALAAIVGIALVFVGNPFAGGSDSSGGRSTEEGAAPGAAADGTHAAPEKATLRPTLNVAFEGTGKGNVRARLINYKDRKPMADQATKLVRATGESVAKSSDANGSVLFTAVASGGDLRLEIEGKTFSPVVVRGVEVRPSRTTDLGDILLGEKVALRGKVIDSKGKPVPGTAVSAFLGGGFDLSQGMMFGMVQSALHFPTPSDEAESDEAGKFELTSLPAGTYRLTAKRSGYAMNYQSDLVVAPERAAGAVTIILGPGATLTGKVTDEKGVAVANATVIALEAGGRGFGNPTQGFRKDFAVTGADGRYSIETLSRGSNYLIGVSAVGWAPQVDTSPIAVEERSERDFTLVQGGAIEGTVTDSATGSPVADARVLVIVGRMNFGGRGGGMGGRGGGAAAAGGAAPAADTTTSASVATTKADGTFRIDGLRPGPVMAAQVKAQGYADYSATQFPGGTPSWGEVKAESTALTVQVKLESGGSVTGKITSALDHSPIPGAQVLVTSQAGMFTGYPSAAADANGDYKIDGVKGGTKFAVIATAPGFAAPDPFAEANQSTMPEEGGVVTRDVALSASGAVEGTVKTSKGEPVAGVRVRTKPAPTPGGRGGMGGFGGRGAWRQLLPGGSAASLTDGEGRYRIENVSADGKLVVEATSDEFVPSESDPFEPHAGGVDKVDLVMVGGGTIHGRVVDDTGRVVAGARVRIGHLDADQANQPNLQGWRADGLLEARMIASDNEGWFEIPRIPAGQTLLKAEKEGYVTFYRRDVMVPADGVLDHYTVALTKGETITGVVKGEDGKAVANAIVAVTSQANPARGGAPAAAGDSAPSPTVEPSMSDRTDDQGRFAVENVPPGTSYSVVVFFAMGYKGWGGGGGGAQGDDSAIRRGVAAGARDIEFVLKKSEPINLGNLPMGGVSGQPGGRVPVAPPAPRPPGSGMGGTPPTVPGGGGR